MKSKFDTLADKIISEGIFGGTTIQQVQTRTDDYVSKQAAEKAEKIAEIKKIFGNDGCDDAKALKILKLMHGTSGNVVEDNLQKINDLVNGYGVESIKTDDGGVRGYWLDVIGAYVNMGDAYAPTVVFDARTNEWLITSWGDVMEDYENNKEPEDEELEELEDETYNEDLEEFFIMDKPMVVRKFRPEETDKVKAEVERIYSNVINLGFSKEDVAKLYAESDNGELMTGIFAYPTIKSGKITGNVFMAINNKYMLSTRTETVNDDIQNLKDMLDEDLTGYNLERDGEEVAKA